jgi:hypothetical protein
MNLKTQGNERGCSKCTKTLPTITTTFISFNPIRLLPVSLQRFFVSLEVSAWTCRQASRHILLQSVEAIYSLSRHDPSLYCLSPI